MKRLIPIVLTLLLIVLSAGTFAMDTEKTVGEVLYHQSFDVVSSFEQSGVCLGTASTENAMVVCPDRSLEVYTYDTSRVYLLLPEIDKSDSDSYTIEFTFRFKTIHSENGYIASILTCRGAEPSNISSVVVRADGSVDNFSAMEEELKSALLNGASVSLKIPVVSGVVHEITLEAEGVAYTLERDNVLMIDQGSMGFMVRNADVEINEVYVVNGVGYEEKLGYYREHSYAVDRVLNGVPEDALVEDMEYAPLTGDYTIALLVVLVVAFLGGFMCAFLLRKRR